MGLPAQLHSWHARRYAEMRSQRRPSRSAGIECQLEPAHHVCVFQRVLSNRAHKVAINFIPVPGMVLMCNFGPDPLSLPDAGVHIGPLSVQPEITKLRQSVIISPRPRRHSGTCIVVPFSTVPPDPAEPFHHCIVAGTYPFFDLTRDSWAKADLAMAVSYRRLDRVRVNGRFESPSLRGPDFDAIKAALRYALAL